MMSEVEPRDTMSERFAFSSSAKFIRIRPEEFLDTGGRRDSNPQQPEPQSGALPLSYGHHNSSEQSLRFSFFFANKGSTFSVRSTNCQRRWIGNLSPDGLTRRFSAMDCDRGSLGSSPYLCS